MAKKDLKLLTILPTTNTVTFSFKPNNAYISGSENLIQRVVKRLLTAKGSNIFNQELGTNFFHLFGTLTDKDIEQAKGVFPMIIQDLTSQIISEQVSDLASGIKYDDADLLSNIILESINYDTTYLGWIIQLQIITKTGETARITVT